MKCTLKCDGLVYYEVMGDGFAQVRCSKLGCEDYTTVPIEKWTKAERP
jgi:hypothetical protein